MGQPGWQHPHPIMALPAPAAELPEPAAMEPIRAEPGGTAMEQIILGLPDVLPDVISPELHRADSVRWRVVTGAAPEHPSPAMEVLVEAAGVMVTAVRHMVQEEEEDIQAAPDKQVLPPAVAVAVHLMQGQTRLILRMFKTGTDR